jgi:hypothetical protein
LVSVMRIVLHDVQREVYFAGPGRWRRDLSEAYDFGHTQRAMEHAWRNQMSEVQVLVVFQNPNGDWVEQMPFPVRPRQYAAVAGAS